MLLLLSRLLPQPLKHVLRGLLAPAIGFRVVKNWTVAVRKSSGYESKVTIRSIIDSDPIASNSESPVKFLSTRYQQIASAFLEGVADCRNSDRIKVLDIGGGLGDYYFLFEKFAPSLKLDWTILETGAVCQLAKDMNKRLPNVSWTDSIHNVDSQFDIVLMSGVVQCVEHPYDFLIEAIQKARFLIINRCPLIKSDRSLLCILRPGFFESKGSYPIHLLSETELISYLLSRGEILSRWMVPEDVAVVRFRRIVHQGLSFRPNQLAAI
jgi:putative methyltransferase (TIGR04325 family)